MCDSGGAGGAGAGSFGPDGMGGTLGNNEPGAASIGTDVGNATGSGGLGGGPGAGKGDNSGAGGGLGGTVGGTTDATDAVGGFGGLGVGGIGALGEGTAVGEVGPGTIGGIASGSALGSSLGAFDPNTPDTMSVDMDADMAAALGPQSPDMAAAMAGTTDLTGAQIGPAMSQMGQVASMVNGLLGKVPGIGLATKAAQMGINSLEGRQTGFGMPSIGDLAMGAIMGVVDPLGLTSDKYGPATAQDAAEYGGSLGAGGIGSASTRS